VPVGTLLRLTFPDGSRVLRFVTVVTRQDHSQKVGYDWQATLDRGLAAVPLSAETVEGILAIDDGDGRSERHERLGLAAAHPRWMATVLCNESQLVYPHPDWIDAAVTPESADLLAVVPPAGQFKGGHDRYRDITPEDIFDPRWVGPEDAHFDGVHALAGCT